MKSKELFFKVSAGLGKRQMSKVAALNKLIAEDVNEPANFGANQPPLGFTIRKLKNRKHDFNAKIYYYIKHDGYRSDLGTRKEVFAWIRANREYHDE